jgi:glycosyltransferase involved in cell wall biosynthesis
MMKLLVIATFPPLKGPEADHAFHLCEHLARHGVDVRVLTTVGSVVSDEPGVKVYRVMRDWSWRDLPRLAMVMRLCSPDAVLLLYLYWAYNHHPMVTFAPTLARWVLPGAPFITQFEDCWGVELAAESPFERARRRTLERWAGRKRVDSIEGTYLGTLLRDSTRYIVVSDQIRARLAKIYPPIDKKSSLVPPPPLIRIVLDQEGTVRERQRQAFGVRPTDILLVYFGYVYPTKGLETLLQAYKTVRDRRVNVSLVIIGGSIAEVSRTGPSYVEEIQAVASAMGLADKVVWTGGYEWDSDLPSASLRAGDVCVLPFDAGVSVHNTSLAAAAAHGLPIITTRGETLDAPFVHQKNVYLCPPKDPLALAEAIELLIDNPETRARMRQGALRLAQDCFSWDSATVRTIAVLSSDKETVHSLQREHNGKGT